MQLIKQDAQATGVTNADIDVNGTKSVLTGDHVSLAPPGRMQAVAKDATPPAVPAKQPLDIPGPPPAMRQVGLSNVANPLYAQWEKEYGPAYRLQQTKRASGDRIAADSARAYNPYLQNRVR